ncbi:RluA family pseudouridine synthase [Pedomonas mirosovicensis]|uniref:RluA family pseudouridine synthase n=1 Tax=Pedomonas mirosovicensis TaxID=2908641 RepID=UPI00216968DB|nr:RluA family pseudouridine synthase [Pedomonas mirosovicensis]MCH8685595.1 RluA family pseudouridine synthase [Pedomonas mirosovicensis]
MTTGHIHYVDIAPENAGFRLDRALALCLTTLSRERIKALISTGEVTRGGVAVRDPSLKVKAGENYAITVPAPRPAEAEAQDIPLAIVYEDDHLLVVDKPAGLVVHPAAGNLDGTLVNALLHHCHGRLSGIGGVARPGIVHRIDKDTSGLLVVAKTDPAHEHLSRQFAAHTVERVYTAVVGGIPQPSAGRIEGALARSVHDRKKMAIVSDGRGRHAITHYRVVRPLGLDAAQVECRLETGRTHQVRVHMASIGHALLGDPTYGRAGRKSRIKSILDRLEFRRQALHAGVLGFVHPITGKTMHFESPLPEDMRQLIAALGDDR